MSLVWRILRSMYMKIMFGTEIVYLTHLLISEKLGTNLLHTYLSRMISVTRNS